MTCALSALAAAAAPALRAGVAVADISPREFPFNMPGLFTTNLAVSVHDPLCARALVLADDTTTLALVVVDQLHVDQDTADEAKQQAAQQCGIDSNKIFLCSTHTHTGPPSGGPTAAAYRKILIAGIVKAITGARVALRPAELAANAAPLPGEVFNRRWFLKPGKMPRNPFGKLEQVKMNPSADALDRPAGPTDPDLSILDVREAISHQPLALFASYSLHYVGHVPKAMASADYYGEFARLMPSRVNAGSNFIALLANGTSGNINNSPFGVGRPPREPFEQIRIVAGKAADTAWRARSNIKTYQAAPRLSLLQREVVLHYRRPTAEQVEYARTVLATKDPAERAKLPALAQPYAERVLALTKRSETVSVPLQVVRIGDLAICGIPFEAFVEIGLDLKKRSPFAHTIVIGLANGAYGYLPTPEQHRLGGYETWIGTSRVQEDASVILSTQLLEMLAELSKDA